MAKTNLPLIPHEIENKQINQRAYDGYINATQLCKTCGKLFGDYQRLKVTKDFLKELSIDMEIPISDLVHIIKGGHKDMQGTWVHPQVAINLGQWASPKFAVKVSRWVFGWMNGNVKKNNLPYHLRRYIVNRHKIPPTHFSMLDEMTLQLMAPLEDYGYILPTNLMPDISMGKMFCGWLKDKGFDPDSFPTYEHVFDDNKRKPVIAKLYPNSILTDFRLYFRNTWMIERATDYFSSRDSKIIPHLEKVIEGIKANPIKQISN